MQTNLEDLFFCDNSQQSFCLNNNYNNSTNNSSYRDVQNYYMQQFNQSYTQNNCMSIVSSSTERLLNNNRNYSINDQQNYQNYNNNCNSYDYWNLYSCEDNKESDTNLLDTQKLKDNCANITEDIKKGMLFIFFFKQIYSFEIIDIRKLSF